MNFRIKKLTAIFTLIILILCPINAYSKPLKKVSIELKWFHQFQFAGIYAAKEQGFYKAEGLDVSILERDIKSTPLNDVLNGKVDFGVSDGSIVLKKLQGKGVVILGAIFQHSPLVLITLPNSKIISPIEIKDKKVMYQKGVDDAIIIAMLNEYGLTKRDFIFVDHNFKDNALLTGYTDVMSAYITNQPYFYKQRNIKVNIIKPQNYGIDFYGDMLFTSEKFFTENKQTSLSFKRATIKGWEYALAHPKQVISWIKTIYKSQKSTAALSYEAEMTKRMISPNHVEIGNLNEKRLNHIANIFKRHHPEINQKATIKGLHFLDYEGMPNEYQKYLYLAIGITILLFICLMILSIINKMMRKKIKEKTKKIESANKEMALYFDVMNSKNLFMKINDEGQIVHISKFFYQKFDFDKTLFMSDIFDHSLGYFNFSNEAIKKRLGDGHDIEASAVFIDKYLFAHEFELYFTSLKLSLNKQNEFLILITDVSEKKQLEKLSLTDSLTDLANRLSIDNSLNHLMATFDRNKQSFSVILLDIDHFKKFNDEMGHQAGDTVLIAVAKTLSQFARKSDIKGRWGGEEFMIICPETQLKGALNIAEKIRIKISEINIIPDKRITASFGIATIQTEENVFDLVKRADKALYEAKASGRNQTIMSNV